MDDLKWISWHNLMQGDLLKKDAFILHLVHLHCFLTEQSSDEQFEELAKEVTEKLQNLQIDIEGTGPQAEPENSDQHEPTLEEKEEEQPIRTRLGKRTRKIDDDSPPQTQQLEEPKRVTRSKKNLDNQGYVSDTSQIRKAKQKAPQPTTGKRKTKKTRNMIDDEDIELDTIDKHEETVEEDSNDAGQIIDSDDEEFVTVYNGKTGKRRIDDLDSEDEELVHTPQRLTRNSWRR